jgi:diguanylate cyclase (GGDEF)-like protein
MYGRKDLSAAVQRKLIERLLEMQAVTVVGVFGAAIVGGLSYADSHQPFFIAWAAASMFFNIAALGIELAYRWRRDRAAPTGTWQGIYSLGASFNGLLCGIGGASSVFVNDQFVQMVQFGTWATFVMSAAARNALYPTAVMCYLGFAELPMLAACLSKHDLTHAVYGGLHIMYIGCAVAIAKELYDQTVGYLRVDEEKATLVDDIRNANAELSAANGRLATIATTDALTGIPNRRSFDEALERIEGMAQREPMHLSLLMLDIDYFKKYNDRYGHPAGDECLRRVAAAVAAAGRRSSDLVARYGGEEFVVLMPWCDEPGALMIESTDSPAGVVTVSIGAGHAAPGQVLIGGQLLDCADAALYESKRRGRNRVMLGSLPPAPGVPVALPAG